MSNYVKLCFLLTILSHRAIDAKIHHLVLNNDKRPYIHLVDFGFLPGGFIQVELLNFTYAKTNDEMKMNDLIGFSLSRGDDVNEYLKTPTDCLLKSLDLLSDAIYFIFDLTKKTVEIKRYGNITDLDVCTGTADNKPEACNEPDSKDSSPRRRKSGREKRQAANKTDQNELSSPLKKILLEETGSELSVSFTTKFWAPYHEGLYFLYFHNCFNYGLMPRRQIGVSFKINISAKNENSYLSSGDIPNPHLYFALAILFFLTTIFWVYVIKTTKDPVYKIHYLMAILLFIKSLSLLFHGVNFYFISTYGHQRELWAIVYYIMHLLKGLLLFGVIILIGTGYTFFKNFLTDRDRKLFMVIIPLQVLDNIALIIIEESEIGQKNYSTWSRLFILIDLICCAAIILPVIWSIRHLQEASQTDGKAMFNLKKLKLFRHFYILIICYIYLTRIVMYLILYTVPVKYKYVDIIIVEIGSWLFFVLTGYKFKPATNNPYLKLALNEDEEGEDMEDIVMQSGALEGIVRTNRASSAKQARKRNADDDVDEEEEIFVNKEISHDLD